MIDAYHHSGRISGLLQKGRADRGKSRLSNEVEAIIETAINTVYLTAEQPPVSAVIEEVALQCFKAKLKTPEIARPQQAAWSMQNAWEFRGVRAVHGP